MFKSLFIELFQRKKHIVHLWRKYLIIIKQEKQGKSIHLEGQLKEGSKIYSLKQFGEYFTLFSSPFLPPEYLFLLSQTSRGTIIE
jgi:hypothetical protein